MSNSLPEMILYAGELTTRIVDVNQADGSATDLTGASIHFTAKKSLSQADEDAEINVVTTSHTDAAAGLSTIEIDLTGASDSLLANGDEWIGDIWIEDAADNRIPQGLIKVIVKPAVTRTFA